MSNADSSIKKPPYVVLVVPCYNETEILKTTTERLTALLEAMIHAKQISTKSYLLYVDDGSTDGTWRLIESVSTNPLVHGLKLTRNFGHQAALLAGMEFVKDVDCVITLDADLQDDISVIPTFVEKYQLGNEIVYGVRDSRIHDTFFKRSTAVWFYQLMAKFGVQLVSNHADFRLLGRRALKTLGEFQESNIFLRGVMPYMGFQSATVAYNRQKRVAGETKYPFSKMLSFAADGIFSFSIVPIELIGTLGVFVILVCVGMIVYSLVQHWLGNVIPGWSSLIVSVWFLGGVQLLSLRVIGEYLGRVFQQTKRRPRYLVEKSI